MAYDTATLKQNDHLTCQVDVRYHRPGSAQMTIVDLGVPPGFAVEPNGFEQLKNAGLLARYSVTGRQVILYFREIRSDRPLSFRYQLRATFPVKVQTPVTAAYQYYEPALRAEAPPVLLTVE